MYDYTITIEERIVPGGIAIWYEAYREGTLMMCWEIPNDLSLVLRRIIREHEEWHTNVRLHNRD